MKKLIYLIAPAILLSACWLQGMKEEEIIIEEQPIAKKQAPQKEQEHVQPTLSVELLPTDKKNEYFIKFLDQLIPTTLEFLQQCTVFKTELNFFTHQSDDNKKLIDKQGPRKIVWDITQLIGIISNDLTQKEIINTLSFLLDTKKDVFSLDQRDLYSLITMANIIGNDTFIQRCASPLIFQLAPTINIPSLRSFYEHTLGAPQIVPIPGTTQFLSGSHKDTIKLWDLNNPKSLRSFNEHTSWVTQIVLIPGTTQFLSGSHDKTIKLWDWNNPTSLRSFKEHKNDIQQVVPISGTTQFLSYAGADDAIKLWDWNNPKSLRSFNEHREGVNQIVPIPGSTQFLSGSLDGTIKLWDWNNPEALRTFNEHTWSVTQIIPIPDTTQFLSSSLDGTIKLWDVNDPTSLRTFDKHKGGVNQLILIPGTTQFLSSSFGSSIKLWDLNNTTSLHTFNEHEGYAKQVVFIPGTMHFLSGSGGGAIKLWDLNNPKALRSFNEHTGRVTRIVLIPNTTQFLSGSDDNTIKLWDYAPFKKLTFPQLELCYKIFTGTKPYTLLRTTGDYELFMSLPQSLRDEATKLKKVKLPFKAQTQPGQRPFKKPGKKK